MAEAFKNTYNDGMQGDGEKQFQKNSSYRLSVNGRIIFNKDGTYTWEPVRGNAFSFNMFANNGIDPSRYIPIGATGNSYLAVVFTVMPNAPGYSEIGLVITDSNGNGVYKTLFNDQNDPNNELLNFQPTNQICARFLYENDNLIRVYWVDGVENNSNQYRVFTFRYDSGLGPRNDVAAYLPVTLSTHSINAQSQVYWGIIKFVQTIGGGLLSGVYQYTYRLATNDGYKSPWYPLTRKLFVTLDDVSNTNWNRYEMEGAGLVTNKGNSIQIKGVDERFNKIEVAYVYCRTDDTVDSAYIFADTVINSDTMSFEHTTNGGTPLEPDEIPAIFSVIKGAKTLDVKDSLMYLGNLIESGIDVDIEAVLGSATAEPYIRDMHSDEYTSGEDGVAGVASPGPITNQVTKTGTSVIEMSTGITETYQIIGDYVNYKGTQVSHLYPGYFRGETYRYGIVFYDLWGFPGPVYHLFDVTFPEQASDEYTYARIKADGSIVSTTSNLAEFAWPTNDYQDFVSPTIWDEDPQSINYSSLRIMGVKFHGIDVSSLAGVCSGFSIVRVLRDKTIIGQGIIMPTLKELDNTWIFNYTLQWWEDLNNPGNVPTSASAVGDIANLGFWLQDNPNQPTTNAGNTTYFLLRPNASVWYIPNRYFGFIDTPTVQTNDKVRLVGGCYEEVQSDNGAEPEQSYFTYADYAAQKLYKTKNTFHVTSPEPFPQYLSEADMTSLRYVTFGSEVSNYSGSLDFKNFMHVTANAVNDPAGFSDGFELRAHGMDVFFLEHSNFDGGAGIGYCSPMYADTAVSSQPKHGFFIANYVREKTGLYGGQTLTALETNIFIGTGHFQPIGNPAFTTPVTEIYDDVEVWGGDCYLDYFGFLRAYGEYWGTPNPGPSYGDMGFGLMFPLESELLHPMRSASQDAIYTDVGARPNSTYDGVTSDWGNGLFYATSTGDGLREEFNLQSSLLLEELVQFFVPLSDDFEFVENFPVRWRYALPKIYGDPTDAWRVFQVNDFRDLQGKYGEITSSVYLFDQIYSWQRSAFGRLRAFDRAALESANLGTLTTGVGAALDGIDYISTVNGNQHQWSLFSSGKAAYWVDVDNRKFMRFAQDGVLPLSDMRGQHDFAEDNLPYFEFKDNPAYQEGILGYFDFEHNDAIWALKKNHLISGSNNVIRLSGYKTVDENTYHIRTGEWLYIDYTSTGVNTDGLYWPIYDTTFKMIYVELTPGSDPMKLWALSSGLVSTQVAILQPNSKYRIINNKGELTVELVPTLVRSFRDTIVYNEIIDKFTTMLTLSPNFVFYSKSLAIMFDITYPQNNYFVTNHGTPGSFFDIVCSSLIQSCVNPYGGMTGTFDAFRGNMDYNAYSKLVNIWMETDNQFYLMPIQTDTRAEYLEDVLRVPLMKEDQLERTRGKVLTLTMEFDNTENLSQGRVIGTTTWNRISQRY